jgi:DNA-binding protein HU-beta
MGPGATQKTAYAAVDAVLSSILSRVEKEKIHIARFGTFETVQRPARTGAHPISGETISIPARSRLTFRPSKNLSDALDLTTDTD